MTCCIHGGGIERLPIAEQAGDVHLPKRNHRRTQSLNIGRVE
jgi:hypothetical protein